MEDKIKMFYNRIFDTDKIVCVGDSNTMIKYFKFCNEKRWSSIIERNLRTGVKNVGIDGRRTIDYLDGHENSEGYVSNRHVGEDSWKSIDADYYIICFGLNDVGYYDTEKFEEYTRELISKIQTETNGIPILMTNVWVDYPDHYPYDRNTSSIKPYDDIKRQIADDLGLHLIDVYERFRIEYEINQTWDTRIRTTSIWDDSQDEGKSMSWFGNIHYNVKGNEIVAKEIIDYFKNNIDEVNVL